MTRFRLAPVLLLGLLVLGCLGEDSRQRRPAGSALWSGPGAEELTSSSLNALNSVDIGEVWFEAASIVDAAGSFELRPTEDPLLPARTPVTLVVRGRWPGSEKLEEFVEELRRLVITYEGRGWIPIGLHLVVEAVDREELIEDLRRLRKELESSAIYISLQVSRDTLSEEGLEELGEAVDFVVCDLYGQLPGIAEDTDYWDLLAVERDVKRLEELAIPYLIGVATVGSVTWLDGKGQAKGHAMNLSLMNLVADRNLELTHGFTLEGIDRQVYGLRNSANRSLGPWKMRIGDRLRIVRLASHHLKELRRRLASWELKSHLGEIYYRQRRPEETLTLSVDQLVAAFGSEAPAPELVVKVEAISSRGSSKRVRIVLENLNGEATDLATIEGNFVELRLSGGHFKYVEPGAFFRYDLLKQADRGEPFRTLNQPDVVRLYKSLVDGFGRVASGPIDIVVRGSLVMEIDGRFLLPDTRTLKLPLTVWPPDATDP